MFCEVVWHVASSIVKTKEKGLRQWQFVHVPTLVPYCAVHMGAEEYLEQRRVHHAALLHLLFC